MTDEGPSELSLEDVLGAAAVELADVRRIDEGGVVTWVVDGVPFAALEGARAEFRLDPMVARAALRTPDTAASERGTEWVAFAPEVLDDGAVDRGEAWFLSGHRRVSSGPAGR